MTESSPDLSDIDISFDQPHYDHQRAAYFIPNKDDEEGGHTVSIEWPLRDEWGTESMSGEEFVCHYREFCESAPEDVFDEPLSVILEFAFNEYEGLRGRLGGGHSYGIDCVDRVSDIGVALRLIQKEREQNVESSPLDEQ